MATAGTKPKQQESKAELPVTRRRRPALARWDRDLEGLFEDFLEDLKPLRRWSRLLEPGRKLLATPLPSTDVYEKDDAVVVHAELPGIKKEDIEITLTDSTLTIKGEKKHEEEVKEEEYHRSERSFGSILRTIDLPTEVKAAEAEATFKDGVLEVRLPKTDEAKRRSVKVQVR